MKIVLKPKWSTDYPKKKVGLGARGRRKKKEKPKGLAINKGYHTRILPENHLPNSFLISHTGYCGWEINRGPFLLPELPQAESLPARTVVSNTNSSSLDQQLSAPLMLNG